MRLATEAARASSAQSGLPAMVTVAQAALESAWGGSELSRKANNYFGIKAYGKRAFVEMPTTEVVGGVVQHVTARFAAFANMEECFACRDQIILHAACYAEARENVGNPEKLARALAKHWATDPGYGEKLVGLWRELDGVVRGS